MSRVSRHLFALLLLSLAGSVHAQPGESVIILGDEKGHRMRGAYAPSFTAQQWLGTKRRPAWTVELHFTVSADYPYAPHEVGTHQWWPLTPDTVRMGGRRHLRFHVIDCWCERKYLLVRRGQETMRIDLDAETGLPPHDSNVAVANEVIVFRPKSSEGDR